MVNPGRQRDAGLFRDLESNRAAGSWLLDDGSGGDLPGLLSASARVSGRAAFALWQIVDAI
jgi:hypothetical protein